MITWLLLDLCSIPLTQTITLPSLMSLYYLNKEGEFYGWPRVMHTVTAYQRACID